MPTYFFLFWALLIATCAAAVRWGHWPERTVAAMYLAAAAGSIVVKPDGALAYVGVEASVFLIDAALLAGLVAVAWRSDRRWPICATAFQFLTVLSHLGKLVEPGLWRLGYQLMAVWAALPAVLALAAGVWTRRRAAARRRT